MGLGLGLALVGFGLGLGLHRLDTPNNCNWTMDWQAASQPTRYLFTLLVDLDEVGGDVARQLVGLALNGQQLLLELELIGQPPSDLVVLLALPVDQLQLRPIDDVLDGPDGGGVGARRVLGGRGLLALAPAVVHHPRISSSQW